MPTGSAPDLLGVHVRELLAQIAFDLLCGGEPEYALAYPPCLGVANGPDEPLYLEYGEGVHAQLVYAEAQKYHRVLGLSGKLAADPDADARLLGGVRDRLYYPQYRRVKRLVQVGHVLVHPVYGEGVLQEVVRAYG